MKPKSIVTFLLIGFVTSSAVYLAAKESSILQGTRTQSSVSVTMAEVGNDTAAEKAIQQSEPKIIAWYFHGNRRCRTCKTIEAYIREAIETGFAGEAKSGLVEFKAVNVEQPQNEHFIYDYELLTRSVVIARYEDGQQKTWRKMDEIWPLLSDKDGFISYFQRETARLLEGDI